MPLYNWLKAYLWPPENIATVDPVKRHCFHVVGATLSLKISLFSIPKLLMHTLITFRKISNCSKELLDVAKYSGLES